MIPLQLLTNYEDKHRNDVLTVVREAVDTGVPYIQFCWEGTDKETLLLAEQIKKNIGSSKLIVNNRIDIALAVEADGIHVGQTDMPIEILTKLVPEYMQVGLTISNEQQLLEAEKHKVDFYGIGPVFNTKTKPGIPLELDRFKTLASMTNRPIVAIGGITIDNIHNVFASGANGVAVIGAVYDSDNRIKTLSQLVKLSNELSDQYQFSF